MNSLSQSKPIVHYAKVDRWLAVLISGLGLIVALGGTTGLVLGLTTGEIASAAALGHACVPIGIGTLLGLMLWGCYNSRYEVTPTDLMVHCGPIHTTVPLDTIVEVYPTKNPLSAPAPSLDRLYIDYRTKPGGKWFTLISPKDKEGFVRDLASAAPQLRRVGDEPLRLKAEAPA